MTRLQAVGVLLIVLGVVYALMYLGWLRRARRHQSAAVAAATGTPLATYRAPEPVQRDATGEIPVVPAPPEEDAPTLMSLEETGQFELPMAIDDWARAEGTYVSTTIAVSRLERVNAAGLGAKSEATMVVDGAGVRWERQGAVPVHVERHTVTAVRLDRGMAGKFVGQNRLVVVSWRAPDGQIYDTGFLPRYKTDTDALIEAVNRLIEDGDL
ncbi:MAG: PH-like domain-containing protein [Oryzihumus sp.]|jgi:hypothetical protein